MEQVKFYSGKTEKEIEAEVIEKREKTWKLRVFETITTKTIELKQKYIMEKKGNVPIYGFRTIVKSFKITLPEKIIIKKKRDLSYDNK